MRIAAQYTDVRQSVELALAVLYREPPGRAVGAALGVH